MRVFDTIEDYIDDMRRYINVAIHQDAELIVFPELLGIMIVPALMEGTRSRRGRQNGQSQRASGSIFQRASLSFLPTFGTDLREEIQKFIKGNAAHIAQVYVDVFGSFAREYGVTIVAPSGYLPDPLTGVIRHMAGVFSPRGDQLGYQSKISLSSTDKGMVAAGKSWDVIPTDVGKLGIILGEDVLYPNVGSLLARQGAEILISMAACDQPVAANRVRLSAIARAQETELFAVLSYTIGDNVVAKKQTREFMGSSAIIAPRELTVDNNNIFIEIVENGSEGVITAELDFSALKHLHQLSNRPEYGPLSFDEKRQMLVSIEEQMAQPLPPNFDVTITEPVEAQGPAVEAHKEATEVYSLNDLPIVASISARWPLMPLIDIIEPVVFEEFSGTTDAAAIPQRRVQSSDDSDDETEEMDALVFGSESPLDGD